MTQSIAHERIMKCRAKMIIQQPFFGVLMMGMDMIISEDIPHAPGMPPTMATDGVKLMIAPSFVDTIDDHVLMFAIAHEIDHAAKKHALRRHGRPPLAWNVACDYSNNLFLEDCGFKIWNQALLDERFRDESGFAMSADRIFGILMKEQEDEKNRGGRSGDDEGDDEESTGIGEPGNEHHSPMLGDIEEPAEAMDPVQRDKIEREMQRKVAQAAVVAKMVGNMPGALQRFVDQILAPQVPWYDKLRHLMTEMKPDDECWSRRNRRCRSIYLPSDYSEHMGGIGIINDTSGSIGNDELIRFNSEGYSVFEDLKPEWVRIMWADTRVSSEQLFEPGDQFAPKPTGGGGTDMRVPLKEMEQHEPEVVVLFTDGHTPWPDVEPPYPLIVACTTQVEVPIGDVIRID